MLIEKGYKLSKHCGTFGCKRSMYPTAANDKQGYDGYAIMRKIEMITSAQLKSNILLLLLVLNVFEGEAAYYLLFLISIYRI